MLQLSQNLFVKSTTQCTNTHILFRTQQAASENKSVLKVTAKYEFSSISYHALSQYRELDMGK